MGMDTGGRMPSYHLCVCVCVCVCVCGGGGVEGGGKYR